MGEAKYNGVKIKVAIPYHCVRNLIGQVIDRDEIIEALIHKLELAFVTLFPGLEFDIILDNDKTEIEAVTNAPDSKRPLAQYLTGLFPRVYDSSLTLVLESFNVLYSYEEKDGSTKED